jgi:hypothetical protein
MSASPRTMRAVTVPVVPRWRRASHLSVRPFGTITLFLASTCILGVTSIGYVWQAGQRIAADYTLRQLNSQLLAARNTTAMLQTKVEQLQSQAGQTAYTMYGMRSPADYSTVPIIQVPGPAVVKYVPVTVASPTKYVSVRIQTTDATVTSWWQQVWVSLYKLLG